MLRLLARKAAEPKSATRVAVGVIEIMAIRSSWAAVSVSTHAANHHEMTLIQLSFDFYMIEAMRVTADVGLEGSVAPRRQLCQVPSRLRVDFARSAQSLVATTG